MPGTGPWRRLIIYKDGWGGAGEAGKEEAATHRSPTHFNLKLSCSHQGNSWLLDYCGLASRSIFGFCYDFRLFAFVCQVKLVSLLRLAAASLLSVPLKVSPPQKSLDSKTTLCNARPSQLDFSPIGNPENDLSSRYLEAASLRIGIIHRRGR